MAVQIRKATGEETPPFHWKRALMLRCGKFLLSLERPLIMGIVNLTPDSFSGDGLASQRDAALDQARAAQQAATEVEVELTLPESMSVSSTSVILGASQPAQTERAR
mgnify:CR=1 FL=1